jgi:hypothetical protein
MKDNIIKSLVKIKLRNANWKFFKQISYICLLQKCNCGVLAFNKKSFNLYSKLHSQKIIYTKNEGQLNIDLGKNKISPRLRDQNQRHF